MNKTLHFYFDCGHHVTRFNQKPSNPWESIIKSSPAICRECLRIRNQKKGRPAIKSFQKRLEEVQARKKLMKRPFVITEIETPEVLMASIGAAPIEAREMLEDWNRFLLQEDPFEKSESD